MSEPLEVLITSGRTISKIDDIRHIGNFSTGTTGALIAEAFLQSDAHVHYVYGKGAKRPFRTNLTVNPENPLEHEIAKVTKEYSNFQNYRSHLLEYPIETFEDYYDTVKKILTEKPIDVVVLAAAVSDYGAKSQKGKISSDLDVLSVEFVRTPKVISLIKTWKPDVFQVGFKLLSGASLDELIETAYEHGMKNQSNLTVANTIVEGDVKKRKIVIITPEKEIIPVNALQLGFSLVDLVTKN